MNDQILLENYLLLLKSTTEVYVHGTLESNNKKIRKCLHTILDSTLNMQNKTYEEMISKGWYQTENIKKEAINKVLNKINSN